MQLTTAQIWERIHAAGIATPEQCRQWAKAVSESIGPSGIADPAAVVKELVQQEKLSAYQANVIYRGLTHPLQLGKLRVTRSLETERGANWYEGEDSANARWSAFPPKAVWMVALPDERLAQVEIQDWPPSLQWAQQHIQVQSPHLDRWISAGATLKHLYAVCESVPGLLLSEMLQQGPLASTQAFRMLRDVAMGLKFLHLHRLVHGHLSTHCVVWNELRGFQLLRDPLFPPRSPYHSPTISLIGGLDERLALAAPELLNAEALPTVQSDLYALGCLWFRCLTGNWPVDPGPEAPPEIWGKLHSQVPVVLPSKLPDVQKRCLLHLLAKDPAVRFSGIDPLLRALDQLVLANAHEPMPTINQPTLEQSTSAPIIKSEPKLKRTEGSASHSSSTPSDQAGEKTSGSKPTGTKPSAQLSGPSRKPAEPKSAEPKTAEPKTAEPKTTEPKTTEPKTTEPKTAEPKTAGPKSAEPKSAEPKSAAPKSAAPKSAEPNSAEPKTAEPKSAEPKSAEPKSAEPKSAEPKSAEPKSAEPKSAEPKSAEPKSAEPKSAEPKTAVPKTAEPKTAEPKTAEPKSAEPKSAEPKSAEPKTAEPKTAEPKTAEPKTTEPKTTEPKTTEPKTAEPKTAEPKTAEPKTAEPKTAEPKTAEPKTAEPKTAEPKTAATKSSVAKSLATNSAVTKPAANAATKAQAGSVQQEASKAKSTAKKSPPKPFGPRKKAKKPVWFMPLVVACSLLLLSVLLLLLRGNSKGLVTIQPKKDTTVSNQSSAVNLPTTPSPSKSDASGVDPMLEYYTIKSDDSDVPWTPPTIGSPLSTEMLPAGLEALLTISPDSWTQSKPAAKELVDWWTSVYPQGLNLSDLPAFATESLASLSVGWYAGESTGVYRQVYRLGWKEPKSLDAIVPDIQSWTSQEIQLDNKKYRYWTKEQQGRSIALITDDFSAKSDQQVKRIAIGPWELLKPLLESQGKSGPLRRQLENLLQNTDSRADVTFLAAPSFVFVDGKQMFGEHSEKMIGLMREVIDDRVQAVLVRAHLEPQLYVEYRMLGNDLQSAARDATQLKQKLENLADTLESQLASQPAAAYWRAIANRFPQMLRTVNKYARAAAEDGQVVFNVYLPKEAATNLAIGSWMALQGGAGTGPAKVASSPKPSTNAMKSVDEMLDAKISLRVEQESLEVVLQSIANELKDSHTGGVEALPMAINGTAFQKDGITRNQQVRNFEFKDTPVREVLTALCRRANPVTTVQKPSEKDQKVVWLVLDDPNSPSKKKLDMTTRAWSESNQAGLPKEFIE